MADLAAGSQARHARHDPLRVAEAVDRGGRLAPVLQFCDACGHLYADLLALTSAISYAARPARSRDFTLDAQDAERLRPGRWLAWLQSLGSTRDAVTRPLAIGLTTFGLVGLLVTAVPSLTPVMGSAAASAEADRVLTSGGAAAFIPVTVDPGASAPPDHAPPTAAAGEPSSTIALSAGLLMAGGGLLAARRFAARGGRMR
ncbi:MAG TPA: hypothetical protein VM408_01785 [Methylomirabilota bacterium]|nr:hypothetical protein [Methylomirabilota bacterium]